ncbi:MAG: hypothetical protein AAF514_24135, partial [Verrucomicrobiota bacterium]
GLSPTTQKPFKVVQLRNLFDKTGFSTQSNRSLSGFGFTHDGSVDTLERFVSLGMFDVRSDQEVADLVSTLITFTGNDASPPERSGWMTQTPSPEGHSAVGTQITLHSGAESDARNTVTLAFQLTGMAAAENIDLIAQTNVNGEPRGFLLTKPNHFKSDREGESVTTNHLLTSVTEPVTFTVVKEGTGRRIALDRDRDSLLDNDEIRDLDPRTPGIQNPFDPNASDSTGDLYSTEPDGVIDSLNDFDGDGLTNGDELLRGENPASLWNHHLVGQYGGFALTIEDGPGDHLILQWPTTVGHIYRIEFTHNLRDWTPVDGSLIKARGLVEEKMIDRTQADELSLQGQRYYRVRDLGSWGG